jgi:hypothetical protein
LPVTLLNALFDVYLFKLIMNVGVNSSLIFSIISFTLFQ